MPPTGTAVSAWFRSLISLMLFCKLVLRFPLRLSTIKQSWHQRLITATIILCIPMQWASILSSNALVGSDTRAWLLKVCKALTWDMVLCSSSTTDRSIWGLEVGIIICLEVLVWRRWVCSSCRSMLHEVLDLLDSSSGWFQICMGVWFLSVLC